MKKISDEKILSLLGNQKSQEQGFRLLMDKYQERMYWQARRMVLDHDDTNDILQNAFIKIFKNIHKFEGKARLYTWLYRIVCNETLTYLTKQKRRVTEPIDIAGDSIMHQLQADIYFDGDEIQLKLQQALGALPAKQRLVFNMRYFEEMSYQDISEVLGTSVGALKASYHHAVKKIEHFLKELE